MKITVTPAEGHPKSQSVSEIDICIYWNYEAVAQLVRVSLCHSEGRGYPSGTLREQAPSASLGS